MGQDTLAHLKAFNKIYKEMDIVYHNYAKNCGLSDMAYWILYSMAEAEEVFTQRDFCRDWFFAPQTVNSALKDLEKRDIIYLEPVPGNKRNKWIRLSENGKRFMEKTIIPIINAKCESLESLSDGECECMLSVTRKYVSALKVRAEKIEENNSIR